MVSSQYGFSCVFSDYYLEQKISDITGTCIVFHLNPFPWLQSEFHLM